MNKEAPKFVIKSEYNYVYEFLSRNGVTVLILLFLLYISILSKILLTYLLMLAIYIIFVVLSTIYHKLKYNANVYKFYNDKIVYTNSFINKQEKRVRYADIKEVNVEQTFLQRIFKLGTIILRTNSGNILTNGIFIYGVKNIDEQYKKMEEIMMKWQAKQSK